MGDIFIRAMLFVSIIIIGYAMKQAGIFRKEDFGVVSKIVLYLTLPSAIIINFSNLVLEKSLIMIVGIGFLCTIVSVAIGYLMGQGKSNEEKGFNMINLTGYNIGCFTLPFAQAFLGPAGTVAICLFDAGNAVMATGGTYALATSLDKREGESFRLGAIIKRLMQSPPLVCYIVMVVLALLNQKLPSPVLDLMELMGNANAFLAMLMIGIGFEFRLRKNEVVQGAKIIVMRYVIALVLAILCYQFLPFDLTIRKAVALVVFSPVSAISPIFTQKLGGNVGVSSTINSLCILVSLFLITGMLVLI
ncbi:MAG: Auxin Efflux Carrier [Clostridia bacterium]|jgi:predicted permease|nr:Auxin Efflux Carrier [Clostridia bacterium]